VEYHFGSEIPRVGSDLRKLLRNAAQIAREELHASRTAMKLRPDAVELVFDIHHRPRIVRRFRLKTIPDRLSARLRAGQHDLDRAKEGEFGTIQFVSAGEECGLADVA